MATFFPDFVPTVGYIPGQYGYLISPPIVWSSFAAQWFNEAGTTVNNGRYHTGRGEAHSPIYAKRQDAYLSGSSGYTGRQFDSVNGSWKDGLYHLQYACYGLNQYDGSLPANGAAANEVVSHDTTTGIEDARLILRLGPPPVESTYSSPVSHQASNTYTYVHLAYQSTDNLDYRLAFEYGQPVRLDMTYDGGQTWNLGVAVARDMPNRERTAAANNYEWHLHVKTSPDGKLFMVEIADGVWLQHSPDPNKLTVPKLPDPNTGAAPTLLPTTGKLRLLTRGGVCAFWYLPARYQGITVAKSARDMGQQIPNAQNAQLWGNSLAPANPNQTTNYSINTDGQVFSWTASTSMPDAGDGLGSDTAHALTDVCLYVPGTWDTTIPDGPGTIWWLPGITMGNYFFNATADLRGMRVVESEVWDDVTRTMSMRGICTCNNFDGAYSGMYGNLAFNLVANNYAPNAYGGYYQRVQGVAGMGTEGIKFTRQDPHMLMELPFSDKSVMMQVALGEEMVFDQWALPSVVRFLCERGNIHPDFISPNIPFYPYGPAGYGCPYIILGSGSGNNPQFRYYPQQSVWSILSDLVLKFSVADPVTGLPAPFYHGFDAFGIYHFEAVSPFLQDTIINYSDSDPSGMGQIEELEVFNSVEDMRTELNFMGLDANTYEVLYFHLPLPPYAAIAKGFRDTWTERNAQFASMDYLQYVAFAASIQASLPQQVVVLKVPFQPAVHAGNLCTITEQRVLGGTGIYQIRSMRNHYGLRDPKGRGGFQDCYSVVTCRPLLNLL